MTAEAVLASETLKDFVRNLGHFVQAECLKIDPKGRLAVYPPPCWIPKDLNGEFILRVDVRQFDGFGFYERPHTELLEAEYFPFVTHRAQFHGTRDQALAHFKTVFFPAVQEKLNALREVSDEGLSAYLEGQKKLNPRGFGTPSEPI